jgi:hypothetical protein
LKPAFGEKQFFYEEEFKAIKAAPTSSGALFPFDESMEYKNVHIHGASLAHG